MEMWYKAVIVGAVILAWVVIIGIAWHDTKFYVRQESDNLDDLP